MSALYIAFRDVLPLEVIELISYYCIRNESISQVVRSHECVVDRVKEVESSSLLRRSSSRLCSELLTICFDESPFAHEFVPADLLLKYMTSGLFSACLVTMCVLRYDEFLATYSSYLNEQIIVNIIKKMRSSNVPFFAINKYVRVHMSTCLFECALRYSMDVFYLLNDKHVYVYATAHSMSLLVTSQRSQLEKDTFAKSRAFKRLMLTDVEFLMFVILHSQSNIEYILTYIIKKQNEISNGLFDYIITNCLNIDYRVLARLELTQLRNSAIVDKILIELCQCKHQLEDLLYFLCEYVSYEAFRHALSRVSVYGVYRVLTFKTYEKYICNDTLDVAISRYLSSRDARFVIITYLDRVSFDTLLKSLRRMVDRRHVCDFVIDVIDRLSQVNSIYKSQYTCCNLYTFVSRGMYLCEDDENVYTILKYIQTTGLFNNLENSNWNETKTCGYTDLAEYGISLCKNTNTRLMIRNLINQHVVGPK